jgi:hypothetical protein
MTADYLRLPLALLALLLWAAPSPAQGFPFSQRGAVQQTIAFTDISIAYGRPVARGRKLFGDSGVVRWNHIWHPGADSASRITVSRDVLVEGRLLPAGTYSLWVLPRATEPWTLVFSRAAHVFHTPYPGEDRDALRLAVPAERGAHMETMAFYFPLVLRDEAVLRLHWGETFIPVRIKAPYRPGTDGN